MDEVLNGNSISILKHVTSVGLTTEPTSSVFGRIYLKLIVHLGDPSTDAKLWLI